ncbi:MAG: hypothetical protein Q8R76_01340 [Candidatus Omnitrophota bacterium]|nr:hypothetical protein [Candidatus Omnitrophota bacterium]
MESQALYVDLLSNVILLIICVALGFALSSASTIIMQFRRFRSEEKRLSQRLDEVSSDANAETTKIMKEKDEEISRLRSEQKDMKSRIADLENANKSTPEEGISPTSSS